MADRLSRAHIKLGVPMVVLSSVIGTSVFATLKSQVSLRIRVAIGMVSVLMAVLASLQTFLRYAERAEKHRVAANLYSALRREMEEVLALPVEQREAPREPLDRLRLAMDQLGKESPEIGEWAWTIVRKEYELDESSQKPGQPELQSAGTRSGSEPGPS